MSKRHKSTRMGNGVQTGETMETAAITAAVPGQRLGWLKRELDAAGVPYQVERAGNGYNVRMDARGAPVADGVLGYQAHGRPPRKPSWLTRLKGFSQKQIYFVQEMVVFFAVLSVLLGGVYFFGLGNLPQAFSLLYSNGGTGNAIFVIRAVALLVIALVVLLVLNKTVGKPPGGMPRGTGTYRFLSVLLIGGLVVALLMAWAGWL